MRNFIDIVNDVPKLKLNESRQPNLLAQFESERRPLRTKTSLKAIGDDPVNEADFTKRKWWQTERQRQIAQDKDAQDRKNKAGQQPRTYTGQKDPNSKPDWTRKWQTKIGEEHGDDSIDYTNRGKKFTDQNPAEPVRPKIEYTNRNKSFSHEVDPGKPTTYTSRGKTFTSRS